MVNEFSFLWYRSNGDGSASVARDTPAIRELVDKGIGQWFGNPEGAIIHGGVIATAFKRKTEVVYDAARWLKTGERVQVGTRTIIEITANREPA